MNLSDTLPRRARAGTTLASALVLALVIALPNLARAGELRSEVTETETGRIITLSARSAAEQPADAPLPITPSAREGEAFVAEAADAEFRATFPLSSQAPVTASTQSARPFGFRPAGLTVTCPSLSVPAPEVL